MPLWRGLRISSARGGLPQDDDPRAAMVGAGAAGGIRVTRRVPLETSLEVDRSRGIPHRAVHVHQRARVSGTGEPEAVALLRVAFSGGVVCDYGVWMYMAP